MTWMTGTSRPRPRLIYWGTGNPTPVLNGKPRPGDDLYTCSIVAVNPDTGKLAWGFSVSPHDTHDWDAVETPVLVDGDFHGEPRKMLLQTSRNGYFFVLDRTNGKSLLTVPYGPVNWALGIDKEGHPIPNPDKEPAPDGRFIAPDEGGLTNYRSPSFDQATGLFIVDARRASTSDYFAGLPTATMALGRSRLRAVGQRRSRSRGHYQTGKSSLEPRGERGRLDAERHDRLTPGSPLPAMVTATCSRLRPAAAKLCGMRAPVRRCKARPSATNSTAASSS